MSKKRITPEVRLTTFDIPETLQREYSLAYTFEIHARIDKRGLLLRDLTDIVADLETTLNNAIKEWCNNEG